MFGRKRAKQVAAKLRGRKVAKRAETKKPPDISPAEKHNAQRDSHHERAKSAPSV
jgi:hypothetical protein